MPSSSRPGRTRCTERLPAAAATILVLVLVLAACGESKPGDDAESADAGPLSAYFEQALGSDRSNARSIFVREQELIAACMNDRGFDYTPVPYVEDDTAVSMWTREVAASIGWNIVAGYDSPPPTSPPDPNAAYVESLSRVALEEYTRAYLGAPDADLESPEQQGCSYSASVAVFQVEVWNAPEYAALNDELSRRWDAIAQDSRVIESRGAWSVCMADAGYPGMTDLDDPMYLIEDRFATELGNRIVEGDAKVAALAADERAIAVIHYDCLERAGFWEAQDAAQADWENEFIEQNRVELESLVEALLESDAAAE